MPNIYFPIGQTATRIFSSDQSIIVTLPETRIPTLIATPAEQAVPYIGQSLLDLDVLMELGNPRNIASKIGKDFYLAVQANWERNLERNLGWLRQEVQALKIDMSKRAQPFLDYAVNAEALSYEGSRVLQANLEVNSYDIDLDKLLEPVYIALGANADAAEPHLKAAGNYIRTGSIGQQTLDFLAGVDQVFDRLKQYSSLEAELQQAEAAPEPTLRDAQKYLLEAIRAIKAGKPYEPEFHRVSPLPYLEDLVGATPRKQFLVPVTEVRKGKNNNGLITPFFYDGSNVPEEFSSMFLHPQKFAQIILSLDIVIGDIIKTYINSRSRVKDAVTKYKGVTLDIGLFVRSLMPDNRAIQTLYPNERVNIQDMPELSSQLESITAEDYAKGEIARLAAEELGMTQEVLSHGLKNLISVQNGIAPLLPLDFYEMLAINWIIPHIKTRLSEIGERADQMEGDPNKVREIISLKSRYYNLADRYKTLSQRYTGVINNLKDGFGIDPEEATKITDHTVDDAIELFGEELQFIKPLMYVRHFKKTTTFSED